MESEGIAIRTGTSEVQIGTQQGNEYRKDNTGMQCWKGTGTEQEQELYLDRDIKGGI